MGRMDLRAETRRIPRDRQQDERNGPSPIRGTNKDLNRKYPAIAHVLVSLPDETVIDGEIVALDETGRPSFNSLQNYGSAQASIFYYVFDVMIHGGQSVMGDTLKSRRELLSRAILPKTAAN
jgi:bifunctional non-homologous end joining protein LigD